MLNIAPQLKETISIFDKDCHEAVCQLTCLKKKFAHTQTAYSLSSTTFE